MKKILFATFLFLSIYSIAQREVNYRKTYYFNESMKLSKCDAVGEVNAGNGSGATAVATINTINGNISGINVTGGGSNYFAAPLISITGGGGSGATAIAIVTEGLLTGFNITSGGSGYTSVPTINFISPPDHETIYKGFEFQIDKQVGSDLVIHFLKWQTNRENKFEIGEPEAIRNNARFFGNAANNKPDVYFKLPITTFLSTMSVGEIIPRFSVVFGVSTVPVKVRMGDKTDIPGELKKKYFDFQGSVNAGFNAGVSLNLNKRRGPQKDFVNFLGGVGLSSVPVDSFSTKGLIKQSTNAAAVSLNGAIIYQRNNLQAGLFFGIDNLAGELGRQWIYKNDVWMGFGVGISLFRSKYTEDKQ